MFLAKSFDQKTHVDDFLDGKLRLHRLSYFRKLETGTSSRSDPEEGVMPWQDDRQVKAIITPSNDRSWAVHLTGPGSMRVSRVDNLNILCLYAALFRPSDKERLSVEERRQQIAVPDEYRKFGDHAVLIVNASEFVQRIEREARARQYSVWRRAVRYVDPEVYDISDLDNEIDAAFCKSTRYAGEREYRFAFDTNTNGNDPITVDIGSVHDIAYGLRTTEINSALHIRS